MGDDGIDDDGSVGDDAFRWGRYTSTIDDIRGRYTLTFKFVHEVLLKIETQNLKIETQILKIDKMSS